jgi:hypothetical protein
MKLFSRLLVAPATLGLLAPLSVTATEVNFTEISNYSDEIEININSFENDSATNTLLAGGEGIVDSHNHDGGFSQTTTLTGSVGFLGAAATAGDDILEGDGEGDDVNLGGTQATYYVGLDLNTSFTGTDNLNVGIESGNAVNVSGTQTGLVSSILDFGAANGDQLKVHNVHYSSTIGDKFSYIVGDSLDASEAFSGACVYSAFTDALSNCGTGNSAGTGSDDDVAFSSSYDIGEGLTLGAGLGTTSGSVGSFSKETDDRYAIQLAYEADSYGLAATYSSFYDADSVDVSYVGLNGYYNFDSAIESVSVGWESGSPETGVDAQGYFVGLNTAPIGPGSLSLGLGTNSDVQGSTVIPDNVEESLIYEAAYSFDINDGVSATIGGFIQERTGTSEDLSGIAFTTSFSF